MSAVGINVDGNARPEAVEKVAESICAILAVGAEARTPEAVLLRALEALQFTARAAPVTVANNMIDQSTKNVET